MNIKRPDPINENVKIPVEKIPILIIPTELTPIAMYPLADSPTETIGKSAKLAKG